MKTLMLSQELHCRFCGMKLREMVDGKTIYGSWAYMCLSCFSIFGVGLGIGRGQVFELVPYAADKERGSIDWGFVAGCALCLTSGLFMAWMISIIVFSILAPIK